MPTKKKKVSQREIPRSGTRPKKKAAPKPRIRTSSVRGKKKSVSPVGGLKKSKPRTRTPKENKFPTGQASSVRGKEKLLGKVDHYFDKINVAAMKLGDSLKVGDTVRIEGGSIGFTQPVASMQIEHESVSVAKKGDEVGFKVKQKVREGYRVFKLPRPLA